MTKLNTILAEFQGELLIPINYQTNRSGKIEIIPPEGPMYIIAKVDKDSVSIPSINFTVHKNDIKIYTSKEEEPRIAVVIARFIQSVPNLFKECKSHRVGYDASKYKKQVPMKTFSERKCEEAFVKKVLTNKKDWNNLREYNNQHRVNKFFKKN